MSKTVMGFDKSGGIAMMAMHCFSILNNGNLLHEIDGKIRAEVPPEGFEAYAEQWPECKDVLSGCVYYSAIDPLMPFVEALGEDIKSNAMDNGDQIAFLQEELAKLIGNPDNAVSAPPADSGEVYPLPHVA